ncbi:hypothetical protein COCOBI_15-0330 [Coccomyxa sp. Obi]|nr:hypothetical protein COCOBI_15-0330 [Coccomyxa sp. Obi]
MSSEPLLERRSEKVNNADSGCCSNTVHPSSDTSDATETHIHDKGKAVIPVGYSDRHPWATLASLKHDVEEDSLVGGSPRSVQTALSMAESIGYSKEFVVPMEDDRQVQFAPVPDGILLASMLCLSAVVFMFAISASYIVLTMVG